MTGNYIHIEQTISQSELKEQNHFVGNTAVQLCTEKRKWIDEENVSRFTYQLLIVPVKCSHLWVDNYS